MPRLRQADGQARRGHHRGSGLRARPLPGDPPRPAKICLHRVRCDYPGPGTADADPARSRHPRHAGASAGVEGLRPPSAVSPERNLCPGRARTRPLDAGRLGWSGGLAARSCGSADPSACLRGREDPRRRHHGAGVGAGTPRGNGRLGLCNGTIKSTATAASATSPRRSVMPDRMAPCSPPATWSTRTHDNATHNAGVGRPATGNRSAPSPSRRQTRI